jgi:hypothetical protein
MEFRMFQGISYITNVFTIMLLIFWCLLSLSFTCRLQLASRDNRAHCIYTLKSFKSFHFCSWQYRWHHSFLHFSIYGILQSRSVPNVSPRLIPDSLVEQKNPPANLVPKRLCAPTSRGRLKVSARKSRSVAIEVSPHNPRDILLLSALTQSNSSSLATLHSQLSSLEDLFPRNRIIEVIPQ